MPPLRFVGLASCIDASNDGFEIKTLSLLQLPLLSDAGFLGGVTCDRACNARGLCLVLDMDIVLL